MYLSRLIYMSNFVVRYYLGKTNFLQKCVSFNWLQKWYVNPTNCLKIEGFQFFGLPCTTFDPYNFLPKCLWTKIGLRNLMCEWPFRQLYFRIMQIILPANTRPRHQVILYNNNLPCKRFLLWQSFRTIIVSVLCLNQLSSTIFTHLATQQGAQTPNLPTPLLLRPLGLMAQDYCLGSFPHLILEVHWFLQQSMLWRHFILKSLYILQLSGV